MPTMHVSLGRSFEETVAQWFTLSRWKMFCCLWNCQWNTFPTANCIWKAAKTQVHTVQRCAYKHHHRLRRLHFCPQNSQSCKNLEGLKSSYSETMQVNNSANEGQKTRWSWLVNKTHKDNKQVMIGHRTVTGSPQNYNWLRILSLKATNEDDTLQIWEAPIKES